MAIRVGGGHTERGDAPTQAIRGRWGGGLPATRPPLPTQVANGADAAANLYSL